MIDFACACGRRYRFPRHAMRVTGLFYHHYKDKLPWSAG